MSDTPQLDRMKEVQDASLAIGEFLEWLSAESGLTLAEWIDKDACDYQRHGRLGYYSCVDGQLTWDDGTLAIDADDGDATCPRCDGSGLHEIEPRLMSASIGIEPLLARYFGVDLDAAERERTAALNAIFERKTS